MFISREEIINLKETAEERIKPIIGEIFIYYHVVGKPQNPATHYGICGSEVVVAGFRYGADESSPYEVDLAVPTRTEDLFVLMSGVKVESAYAQLEGEQKVVFVEYEHREWVQKAVAAWVESLQPAKKKPNHLSLVVDNVNTVESLLIRQPQLEAVATTSASEMDASDILDILRTTIGKRFMPTSLLTTVGKQKSPMTLKAADDGDFVRQLLLMESSGLFKRDALRSNEIFAVLNMDSYKIIVTLTNEQVFMGARDGVRLHEWVPRSGVDVARLMLAVNDL
jgi:hypothetical protein